MHALVFFHMLSLAVFASSYAFLGRSSLGNKAMTSTSAAGSAHLTGFTESATPAVYAQSWSGFAFPTLTAASSLVRRAPTPTTGPSNQACPGGYIDSGSQNVPMAMNASMPLPTGLLSNVSVTLPANGTRDLTPKNPVVTLVGLNSSNTHYPTTPVVRRFAVVSTVNALSVLDEAVASSSAAPNAFSVIQQAASEAALAAIAGEIKSAAANGAAAAVVASALAVGSNTGHSRRADAQIGQIINKREALTTLSTLVCGEGLGGTGFSQGDYKLQERQVMASVAPSAPAAPTAGVDAIRSTLTSPALPASTAAAPTGQSTVALPPIKAPATLTHAPVALTTSGVWLGTNEYCPADPCPLVLTTVWEIRSAWAQGASKYRFTTSLPVGYDWVSDKFNNGHKLCIAGAWTVPLAVVVVDFLFF